MKRIRNPEIHVLIVDCKAFTRSILGEALQAAGVDVISAASDSRAAAEILAREPQVNLVFYGMATPGMCGVEFVRYVASNENTPSFVFMNEGPAEESDFTATKIEGVTVLGSIPKPISFIAIQRIIDDFRRSARA